MTTILLPQILASFKHILVQYKIGNCMFVISHGCRTTLRTPVFEMELPFLARYKSISKSFSYFTWQMLMFGNLAKVMASEIIGHLQQLPIFHLANHKTVGPAVTRGLLCFFFSSVFSRSVAVFYFFEPRISLTRHILIRASVTARETEAASSKYSISTRGRSCARTAKVSRAREKLRGLGSGRGRSCARGEGFTASTGVAMATRIRARINARWDGGIWQLAKNAKLDAKLLEPEFS